MKKIVSKGATFIVSSAFFHIQKTTSSSAFFFKTMAIFMTINLLKILKIMAEKSDNLHLKSVYDC